MRAWTGCISLGAAYTYYQKKRAEQIDQAVHKDQLENTANASASASKTEEKKEDPKPKSESESKDNKDTKKEPTNKPDDSKKTAPEKEINYQQVYNDIAELLDSNEE